MQTLSKKELIQLRKQRKVSNVIAVLENKSDYINKHGLKYRNKRLKKWYKKNGYLFRCRFRKFVKGLCDFNMPFNTLEFLKWIIIDFMRGKDKRNWGIYQFVALPGQGKTMSMVAHMERFIKENNKRGRSFVIATNFNYVNQDYKIDHWLDIIEIAKNCYKKGIPCLIAVDEIHITFDSADWKSFPPEMLALLSFNRKYCLQFLCSAQIYDRIPKKIRDIANYTVICKNVLDFDRYFRCYYYEKENYESSFEGKRAKCKFIRDYVAGDYFYGLYNTLEQVEQMVSNVQNEKSKRQQAFDILFGGEERKEGENT